MPTPFEAVQGELDREASFHLCRSALYAAVGLGLLPPTRETLERLCAHEANDALADAAAFARRSSPSEEVETNLTLSALGLVRELGSSRRLEDLVSSHRRLFGHTAKGEVPAYETEYGDEALFQQPQELADLAGFMQAFGLTLRPEVRERVDHVSCECEFLSFLACKEAYALTQGVDEMRDATAHATRLFLRDHLARFAPAFARRVLRARPHAFYESLARLLSTLVAADCRRLRIPLGSEGLSLRPDPATCAAPLGCSAGEEGGCGAVEETR